MSDIVSYQRVCGIDVAKETLEGRIIAGDLKLSFSTTNDASGFARVVQLCRKHQVQIVVLEATGGLQRKLAVAIAEAQIPVAIINPARIRHFALAEGMMAKTDKVDAAIIAAFALKIAPRPAAVRTAQQEALARIVARKGQILKMKVAEENRKQQECDPLALKSIDRILRLLEKEIARQDEQLQQLVECDPILQLKAEIADAQKGIGQASAVALVVVLPELGKVSGKEISALAGVAPFNKDSGKLTGARHIAGGRAQARSVLYMCTLSAVRWDPKLKAFYERLLAAGKCKMKAITACMHKLLVVLNARVRDGLAARAACA